MESLVAMGLTKLDRVTKNSIGANTNQAADPLERLARFGMGGQGRRAEMFRRSYGRE